MAHEVQFNLPIVQEGVNFLLQLLQTQLFVNVTVKQLMEGRRRMENLFFSIFSEIFIGYTDPLIETASIVKPGVLKDNKFGILQPVKFIVIFVGNLIENRRSREMVHTIKTSRLKLDTVISLK